MTVNSYLTEQEKSILEHAVIGIAGAGGLGSNCAMHLVRSGVRKFVIADFDTVSAGNLNRQFFFTDQIGRSKVEALAENLRRIEPSLELELHSCRLTAENMPAIFSGCDIVVECFDDPDSKMTLIRLMSENGRTVVGGKRNCGLGEKQCRQTAQGRRELLPWSAISPPASPKTCLRSPRGRHRGGGSGKYRPLNPAGSGAVTTCCAN